MLFTLLFLVLGAANAAAQKNEYEYVVIGSGPGGGTLAASLARAGHSVFLIEAGEDHGDSRLQRIPFFSSPSSEDPTMSWEFFVHHYSDPRQAYRDSKYTWLTPDNDYHVGLNPPNGSKPLGILYPRTGTLGGCGNHNAMNLALPPDRDWDAIAELTGDDTWRAENIRSLFENIEANAYIKNTNGSEAQGHGFGGFLHSNLNDIELQREDPAFLEAVGLLLNGFGHSANSTDDILTLMRRDLNRLDTHRYERNDVYQIPIHYDAERRRSSAQTYLRDTVNELNDDGTSRFPLTISTSSLATRVIFENNTDSDRPRAVGVEYLQGQALYRADPRHSRIRTGIPRNVTATREVIVAGGAFNTPQILKLSGVGPLEELQKFGIPVVVDLPAVGTNLQDNYEAGILFEAAQDFPIHALLAANCTMLAPGDPCLRQWEKDGSGIYGVGGAGTGMLFRSSVSENADADLFFFGTAGAAFQGHFPGHSRHFGPPNSFFWSVVKMQSQNRAGTVLLKSADPQDTPEINFNYFAEGGDHDLQAIMEGINYTLSVFNSIGAPYGPYTVVNPSPNLPMAQSIKDQAFSHHATSSCAIGINSTTSCVDSNFKVHGVDGLRVVDASVFPRVPGGFPILPTFLLGAKAAGILLAEATLI